MVEFASEIVALNDRAERAEEMESRLRARFLLAQEDAGVFMRERDEARAERDAARASSLAGLESLANAIETLRWICHGHTNSAEAIRDVARRRLEAMGVKL